MFKNILHIDITYTEFYILTQICTIIIYKCIIKLFILFNKINNCNAW